MNAVRVLMVVRLFYPWVGGAERQAHKLAKELMDLGQDVELVTGWWFWGTPRREVIDGIPVQRNFTLWDCFGIKGLRKVGGYLYILSLLWYLWRRRADYDLIHVHGLNYHTFAAVLAARWLRKPTVTKLANSGPASDIHKMRRNQQLALSKYMTPTALRGDCYVALNATIVDELRAAGVPAHKIVELPNGVETEGLTVKTSYVLHDPARILFVGRLHPQKGLDVLLHAVHLLLREYAMDPIRLQLVGDGPLRDELGQLASELGIAEQVEFWGRTDTVLEHLPRADLFVLPSRAEGLSNALLEAMACGLPVVASRIPGNVDVVQHEQNGLLCPVDDPRALAHSIHTLLQQPALRAQLGRAARTTVENEFGLNHIANRYIGLYHSLVQEQRSLRTEPHVTLR